MRDEEEDVDNAEEKASEPKGYREGPSVSLGSGMLEAARQALLGRRKTVDEAIKETTKRVMASFLERYEFEAAAELKAQYDGRDWEKLPESVREMYIDQSVQSVEDMKERHRKMKENPKKT